jgi:beta-lactamase superfamily II metal-dependent hydrolase
VGKGNCTIIDFPSPSERLSVIDIDNSRIRDEEDVLTDPIDYISTNFGNRSIFRFILTHPDLDHLSGLNELAENVSVCNFWDTEHDKVISEDDWADSPYNQKDWERYLQFRESSKNPKCLQLYRSETSTCCWTQDRIKILSPSSNLVNFSNDASESDAQKYHHLSYVLIVEYAGVKVLIGGDASPHAWEEISNECGGQSLKAHVFLAPHHGSKNNVHRDVFKAIAPDYVIVSVAQGVEYDRNYYNDLAKSGALSTKFHGTIVLHINDDGTYKFYVEKNA